MTIVERIWVERDIITRTGRPDTQSVRHMRVWERGISDAVQGRHDNPYEDKRCGPHDNIVTGSRGYRNYWQRGHDAAMTVIGQETGGVEG